MKGNSGRIAVAIIGIIAGAVTVILGLALTHPSVGGFGSHVTFGADFYTEMYSITQVTAQNVADVVDLIFYLIKCLLISLGIFEILFFVYKLVSVFNESDSVKQEKTEYEEVKEIENELPEI